MSREIVKYSMIACVGEAKNSAVAPKPTTCQSWKPASSEKFSEIMPSTTVSAASGPCSSVTRAIE